MTIGSENERDLDYICRRCGGNVVVVREENGRNVFNCDTCHKNELLGCTICHKPRSIWADDENICGLCALEYLNGNLSLTPQQVAGIEKWRVKHPNNKH